MIMPLSPASAIHEDIVSLIGHTPVVHLDNPLVPHGKSLMVKLESMNPNFSVKDRTALGLVRAALADGRLEPGGTLVESTSGNLGKSLAMLGAAIGFRTIIVVDPKVSPHNLNWCRAYGAQVIMVDTPDEHGGYQSARLARVREIIAQNPGYYWCNQYENPDNPRFHEEATAPEFDFFPADLVAGAVSTGGHMSGIARGLRKRGHPCRTLACDVAGSAIFGGRFSPYLLNGVGLAWRSSNMDMAAFSGHLSITDADAISMCRVLARDAGLLLGGSGGLSIFGALAALHTTSCESALALVPDSGVNYLDQFYDDDWIARRGVVLKDAAGLRATLAATQVQLAEAAQPVSAG